MVTIRDFCPINRWDEGWLGTLSPVIRDKTTGTVYSNRPIRFVRLKCLQLAAATPILHLMMMMVQISRESLDTLTLAHFRTSYRLRHKKSIKQWIGLQQNEHWALTATKQTAQDIVLLLLSLPLFIGLELSALYGVLNPRDGRKLYGSFERLRYSEPLLSTSFRPRSGIDDQLFDGRLVCLLTLSTLFHEWGHYLAIKHLYEKVTDLTLNVGLPLGFGSVSYGALSGVSWSSSKLILNGARVGGYVGASSTIGPKWFNDRITQGLTFAGGPLFDLINVITSTATALILARRVPHIACPLALNAVVVSIGSLEYALSPLLDQTWSWEHLKSLHSNPSTAFAVSHDYESMARLFSIRRSSLVALAFGVTLIASTAFYYVRKRGKATLESKQHSSLQEFRQIVVGFCKRKIRQ